MNTRYNSVPFRNLKVDIQYRYTPAKKDNVECEGFVLTRDNHGFVTNVADSQISITTTDLIEIKRFLCKSKNRKTINFILNFAQSIKCIFKQHPALYTNLQHHKTVTFDGSRIKLHKHCLIITYNKHNWYFYDLSEYRDTETIKTAKKTQKTAQETMDFINKVFFIPKRLYSLTHLIKDFALSCAKVPLYTDTPEKIQEMYWHGTAGGLIKSGLIKIKKDSKKWKADITSAYPAQIINLPDLKHGVWYNKIINTAKIGVIKCIATPPNDLTISPLAITEKSIVYITLQEYKEYKDLYKLTVLDAYSFVPTEHTHPFRKYIAKWWYVKQNKDNKPWQKTLAKNMMNLLSGLFLHKLHDRKTNTYTIGQLFNPIYYATVTANTRLQVWQAIKNDLNNIIEIKTDSVLSTKKLNIEYGTGLGNWCLE